MVNNNLVLICGTSGGGKSASLRNIPDPEGVMYLCCESGKNLPFPAKFMKAPDGKSGFTITDPLQIYEAFTAAETMPKVHTIVIDSITFLMDMYESVYVIGSSDGMKAWQNYQEFFKNLMQQHVAKSTKNVIFTAHTLNVLNESEMVVECKVPIKGALKSNGIEAWFSTVVTARKISVKALKDYQNEHLIITPEEEALGFKYVYQTKITKDTINHRIRSSIGLWQTSETFIDNDAHLLLQRLHQYHS